jgi:hypothetical protein
MDEHYGVAYAYATDTYTLVGAIADATVETIDKMLFVHNAVADSVEKTGDTYQVCKMYKRIQDTGTEMVVEVSLLDLDGFSLCDPSMEIYVLYWLEYGVWQALGQPYMKRFDSNKVLFEKA